MIENVLFYRRLFYQNLFNLIFVDLIAGQGDGYATQHSVFFAPLYGTTSLFLFMYSDENEAVPQWYYGYYWYFDKNWWVDMLLWIFLVIPIAVFVYWIYETSWLRKYRLRLWAYVVNKVRGPKDSGVVDSEQPRGSN